MTREIVFEGRKIKVAVDTLTLASGRIVRRDVVIHPGAVAIVPLVDAFNELVCFPLSLGPGWKLALRPALCMRTTLTGTVVPVKDLPLIPQVLHSGPLVSFSHHDVLSVVLQPSRFMSSTIATHSQAPTLCSRKRSIAERRNRT